MNGAESTHVCGVCLCERDSGYVCDQRAAEHRCGEEVVLPVLNSPRIGIGVRISLAELLLEDRGDKAACKQVVELAGDVDNSSPLHAALLLFKGKALAKLGLHTAARDALTAAFRRKKDRPDDLLHEIQYQRALVYEQLGRKKRSRQQLEKLYAADPSFEDVAERLDV